MTVKRVPVTVDWTQTGSSSGLLSARPAASTAGAGYVYTATDTGISYVSNGHDWFNVQVDSIASAAPSGSAGGDLTGTYPNPTLNANQDANARVGVRKNSAGSTFKRRRVNLIEGTNVTLTVADDSGNEEVDVTIAASGGGGSVASDSIWDAKGDLAAGTGADTASKLTVGSDGQVLSADSSQSTGLKWIAAPGGGVGAKLYDYTVTGSDKASIDTNVDGTTVANFSGYDILEVLVIARTDDAGANPAVDMTVNNDTGNNYDQQYIYGSNITATANKIQAAAKWILWAHGTGGSASYPAINRIVIPGYAATVFNKVAETTLAQLDATAGNQFGGVQALGWRSTAAITRIKVAAQSTAKLKVGSRLIVYGR